METQDLEESHEIKPEEEEEGGAREYQSNIDSSRPFRSVKEAVAIFGEKFLAGDIYAPKNCAFPHRETPICYYTPSPSPQKSKEISPRKSFTSPARKSFDHSVNEQPILMESLKKLEAELEETKMELRMLKERESETEVAVASLNAELHKNMSKLAQAEAAAASKALASRSNSMVAERSYNRDQENIIAEEQQQEEEEEKEKMRRDLIVRWESSTTLGQVLKAAGEKDEIYGIGRMRKEKKSMKKKPIIPLVADLFSRRKGNSTTMHNPLFASSHLNLN